MKHNRQKGQVGLLLLSFIGFAVFLFLMFTSVTIYEARHRKMLEENDCSLYMEAETGREVSCGKACRRPEIKRTYMCRNGWYEELV